MDFYSPSILFVTPLIFLFLIKVSMAIHAFHFIIQIDKWNFFVSQVYLKQALKAQIREEHIMVDAYENLWRDNYPQCCNIGVTMNKALVSGSIHLLTIAYKFSTDVIPPTFVWFRLQTRAINIPIP
jgi:hypothetical protein